MGDIVFTGVEVAIITALLGAMSTPIAFMFHALRASYMERIKECGVALDHANSRVEELRPALDKLTEAVREQSRLIERLVDDRERGYQRERDLRR